MHKIIVNKGRCKRCGICIEFCPVKLFDTETDRAPLPQRQESCTGCRLCELRCPDFAIKVEVTEDESK